MHAFDDDPPPAAAIPFALRIWSLCLALLVCPSIFVWFVRLSAFAAGCEPGPAACRGMALGSGFHDTLAFAWVIGGTPLLGLIIACVASGAALSIRRPLLAALSLLVFPLVAVTFPALAVLSALHQDCAIADDGVADCTLWGAQMGDSFHTAATASAALYDMVPYSFALALMVAAIGFVFFRPRAVALR